MRVLLRILLLLIIVLFTGCHKDVPEINTGSATAANDQSLKTSLVSTDIPIASISASSTYSSWDVSNAIDNNTATTWSSGRKVSISDVEFIQFQFSGANDVNYVKLTPRYGSNNAGVCFPLNFTIYYYTGAKWVPAKSFTNFANPQKSGNYNLPVIIPLPVTVRATAIKIEATRLRADGSIYYFQLAEVAAGFDDGFNHFKWTGNDNASRQNRINNAGSDTFNPSRIFNWTQDDRDPIIQGTAKGINPNIYAPNIVNNGGAWNIYYGGWDNNTSTRNDRIFTTVTHDNFLTFGTHTLMIGNGDRLHVNNETVLKKTDGSWLMYYTSLPQNSVTNKPSFATSADGVTWAPNVGSGNSLLSMANYPNWATADVNGSNVGYLENGIYHLFFNDFATRPRAVHHATSTDGINFSYTGDALAEDAVAQDVKAFTYNNTTYYLMGTHRNGHQLRYSLSNSLTSFPASHFLFGNYNEADLFMVSMGFVANANRLYGIIYGAGPGKDLSHNALHARWLTKKIIFISDRTNARWGDIEKAHGPNQVVLYMNTEMETGHFYIYDTDGTTLLYTSPQVTMRSGDVWTYNQ
jgi:F5/8 type C domain